MTKTTTESPPQQEPALQSGKVYAKYLRKLHNQKTPQNKQPARKKNAEQRNTEKCAVDL